MGGAGDDFLRIGDAGFTLVDGGEGLDTLILDGTDMALNLTEIDNNKVAGIETIDMTGAGNNVLTLDVSDVLDASDSSDTLIILGNPGDTIANIGDTWTDGGVSGGFHTYTSGGATLIVEVDVAQTGFLP